MSALQTSPALSTFRRSFAIVAIAILCVPLIAMQFTSEVNWQIGDFAVFALMLAILGGAIELALRFADTRWAKASAIAASLLLFLIVWAALAVG